MNAKAAGFSAVHRTASAVSVACLALVAACRLDRLGSGELIAADGDAGLGGSAGAGGAADSSVGGSGAVDAAGSGGAGGMADAQSDAIADAPGDTDAPPADVQEAEAAPPPICTQQGAIQVVAGSAAVPADYSVYVEFDHAALVTAGRSLASGDDVLVVHRQGAELVPIHRFADPGTAWGSDSVRVWFRLANPIQAGATDGDYALCWAPEPADAVLDDPQKVFLVWDGFDDGALDPAWTLSLIGNATGTAAESGGALRVTSRSGDFWGTGDDMLFYKRPISGDFVADARVSAFGGTLDDWAKVGGVMIRQDTSRGSRNRTMSPVNGAAQNTNSYRLQDGADTHEETSAGANPIPEYVLVRRLGDRSEAAYGQDGLAWTPLGAGLTFAETLDDPILLGVPLATLSQSGDGWVEVDWFRARRWVSPEPVAALVSDP